MDSPLPRSADALLHQCIARIPAMKKDAPFVARLSLQWPALYRLMGRLYGARPQWHDLMQEMVSLLWSMWQERDTALRSLDSERLSRGAWYLDGHLVGMQLYVDRAAGSLKQLEKQLDYYGELGISLLHLMPLLRTPRDHNDGGYAVSDYREVQEELGTMEDLRALTREMHRRGMVVALDYVLNHTSDEHRWAQAALAGDPTYQDYYFMYPDRAIPDRFEEALPEVFPETAPGNFTWKNEIQRWVMTVFHTYQWDLNYGNPRVLLEMVAILLHLANQGVDILRLDAVPYLWKSPGTASQNLPEAHVVAQLLNACARVAAPGVAFIAEAIVQPREIARYFGEGSAAGRECELAYNASLMVLLWDALATGRAVLLRRGLEDLPRPAQDTGWLNYVRCHDDIGLGYDEDHLREQGWDPPAHRDFIIRYYTGEFPGSHARGARFMYNPRSGDARISGAAASLAGIEAALSEKNPALLQTAIDRVTALYGIIFALGGIPIVYSGDELGLCNDYSYREEPHLRDDNRWMHRPRITTADRDGRKKKKSVAGIIFRRLQRMISLRNSLGALASPVMPDVHASGNPHTLALLRHAPNAPPVLILVNFSDQPVPVESQVLQRTGFAHGGHDVLHDEPFLPVGHLLPPYRCAWVVPPAAAEGGDGAREAQSGAQRPT